jgi:hypothetical protein
MTREIRFNAFDMNCVGHQSPGLWAHPRDRSWQYKDLEYWAELAEILERGNLDAAFRNSTQIPVNDPLRRTALAEDPCRRAVPKPREPAARARRRGMKENRND